MALIGTAPLVAPRHSTSLGAVTLHDSRVARTQGRLARSGALMLPLGLIVIALGWSTSGAAPLDERSGTVLWAGFGGLAVTCVGAALYVGSWLARIAIDSRGATDRLAETSLLLADALARASMSGDHGLDLDSLRVTAGGGVTVHRRDCVLISHRDDLSVAVSDHEHRVECRVCRP